MKKFFLALSALALTALLHAAAVGGGTVLPNTVGSSQIVDGSIVDADINASAAIALSKLASDPSNATNLSSGTVPTARLGSGSASSSTYLRGDQTWAAVSSFPSVSTAEAVYVSKAGNDSTGNGTPSSPYLTIAQALSVITDSGLSKRYMIFVGPGAYTEANLVLKIGVWIEGAGNFAGGPTRVTVSNPNITPDSNWSNSTGGGARGGFQNIYFTGSTALNFDLTTQSGNNSTVLEMMNVSFNGSVTYKAKNSGDGFYWNRGTCFGNLDVEGANSVNFFGLTVSGTSLLRDGPSGVSGSQTIRASLFNGNVTCTSNFGGNTTSTSIYGSHMNGTLTLTQTAGTLAVDLDAISYPTTAATVNSGTLTLDTSAFSTAYTPGTSGDWPVQPTQVAEALNKLAARVKALEP